MSFSTRPIAFPSLMSCMEWNFSSLFLWKSLVNPFLPFPLYIICLIWLLIFLILMAFSYPLFDFHSILLIFYRCNVFSCAVTFRILKCFFSFLYYFYFLHTHLYCFNCRFPFLTENSLQVLRGT